MLEVSDRTRVLHGALQLPTFTLGQLAELTGVRRSTVQNLVLRSRDLIEEVVAVEGHKLEGEVTRYRLRESARAKLAREAVEIAERLRGLRRTPAKDAARTATVALDAVESSVELGRMSGNQENWQQRARDQLNLSRRLLVLVSDPGHRAPLQRRLVQLAGRLEGSEEVSESEAHATPIIPVERAAPAEPATSQQPPGSVPNGKPPRTIWKYPNRRLYDAAERRYITLADIRRFVHEGVNFVVIDRKGREDITRSILLHIIAEQEQQGDPSMTRNFLAEVIRFYGSRDSGLLGGYLDHTMKSFEPPPPDKAPPPPEAPG